MSERRPPALLLSRRTAPLLVLSVATTLAVAPLAGARPSAATPAHATPGQSSQRPEHRWLGPDLEILPLTDDEVVEFLRTADVVAQEFIDIGVNGIDRLTLEQDGIRLRAGFRQVELTEREARVGNERYLVFRDSAHFECAAYAVAQLLGIDSVPPTTRRTIDGVDGSVQLWLEDLFEDSLQVTFPAALEWAHQLWTMKFFDALIYNVDRNPGNFKVDRAYRVWMIDHTRAFQRKSSPYELDDIQRVRADVWERLQRLQREDFESALAGLLEPIEIKYLMDRRAALIDHLAALLAERPTAAVLY